MVAPTIFWDIGEDSITFIDQTKLPEVCETVQCTTVERLAEAIRRLEIRGAPALGVAGAYGVALSAQHHINLPLGEFFANVKRDAELLRSTRPTAVNLGWGIDRVLDAMQPSESVWDSAGCALLEADAVHDEDVALCHAIGEHGAKLLPDTCTVLTHCNAGSLACAEWGTALGVIRSAVETGKKVQVFSCETRPVNQGSRLTAWELSEDNIPVTTIADSAAAYLMQKGLIDAVIVGADRITGDAVFNKIGTYMHAVTAQHHQIPFYVAAPTSTFDTGRNADDVVVEERDRDELACCGNKHLMPENVPALNYAFDQTPLSLISGIITEKRVFTGPFDGEWWTDAEDTN